MKNILPVLLLLCMNVTGQVNTYLSADTLDEIVLDGLYYEQQHYFLSRKGVFTFNVNPLLFELEGYTSYLIRLDENLNLTDSLEFAPYDGYLIGARNLLIKNDTIYVFGRAVKPDVSDEQIFMASVNMDFEMINFTLIGSPDRSEIISNAIINHNNDLVISAKDYVDFENKHFILYECDKAGNILNFIQDTSWHTHGAKVLQLPVSNTYHFIGSVDISIYNSELEKDTLFYAEVFKHLTYRGLTEVYQDDTYFVGGESLNVPWNLSVLNKRDDFNFYDMTYYRLDEQGTTLDSGFVELPDVDDLPKGMDFLPPNTLFMGGVHDFVFANGYHGFREEYQWLVVQSLDYDTKQENWLFKYGGDVCYYMYGLYALPDGGAVVYATRYDWPNTDKYDRNIMIMQIDSTGLLVGDQKPYEVDDDKLFNIYPNPGSSALYINTKNACDFKLYNTNGNQVIKTQLHRGTNTISVIKLIPGIYFYKIYCHNSQQLITGKWIKR